MSPNKSTPRHFASTRGPMPDSHWNQGIILGRIRRPSTCMGCHENSALGFGLGGSGGDHPPSPPRAILAGTALLLCSLAALRPAAFQLAAWQHPCGGQLAACSLACSVACSAQPAACSAQATAYSLAACNLLPAALQPCGTAFCPLRKGDT